MQEVLDTSDVTGCILVYDPQAETSWTNDTAACRKGHLPASTFKIPNTLIALETGVMESDSTLLHWNGEKRRLPEWETDLSLRDAFRVSCVPCYQEIARKIGPDRMIHYLDTLGYGHMQVDSSTIDLFWLEGESHISPLEQVDFLTRFYFSQLPLSPATTAIMRRIMVLEKNEEYTLSAKTGWSVRNGNNNGWFVGYLEKGGKVYFFATNIDPREAFDMKLFAKIRSQITLQALKSLNI